MPHHLTDSTLSAAITNALKHILESPPAPPPRHRNGKERRLRRAIKQQLGGVSAHNQVWVEEGADAHPPRHSTHRPARNRG